MIMGAFIGDTTYAPATLCSATIAPKNATNAPRQMLRRYDICSADNCSADNCSGDNCSADNCSGDICSGVNCSADNCFAEICSEHAEGMTFAPPTIIAPLKYAPKIIHAPQQYLFHRHLLCRRLNRQLNSQDCV